MRPLEIIEPSGSDNHQTFIEGMLGEASQKAGHPFAREPVALVARIDGADVGGITGQVLYGWLSIQLLAVGPDARGRGVGRRLMETAESLAREQGAIGAHVDTFAYQAPRFYECLGYRERMRLRGPVPAEDRIFYVKHFIAGQEPA